MLRQPLSMGLSGDSSQRQLRLNWLVRLIRLRKMSPTFASWFGNFFFLILCSLTGGHTVKVEWFFCCCCSPVCVYQWNSVSEGNKEFNGSRDYVSWKVCLSGRGRGRRLNRSPVTYEGLQIPGDEASPAAGRLLLKWDFERDTGWKALMTKPAS